jgi:hypothetical protein
MSLSPCNKNYGPVPVRCRRLAGHAGDCGAGNDVESALCRALDATAHIRKLELEGENIPGELWNFVVRSPAPIPDPEATRQLLAAAREEGRAQGRREALEEAARLVAKAAESDGCCLADVETDILTLIPAEPTHLDVPKPIDSLRDAPPVDPLREMLKARDEGVPTQQPDSGPACVCPFPRETCPNCPHLCAACYAATARDIRAESRTWQQERADVVAWLRSPALTTWVVMETADLRVRGAVLTFVSLLVDKLTGVATTLPDIKRAGDAP